MTPSSLQQRAKAASCPSLLFHTIKRRHPVRYLQALALRVNDALSFPCRGRQRHRCRISHSIYFLKLFISRIAAYKKNKQNNWSHAKSRYLKCIPILFIIASDLKWNRLNRFDSQNKEGRHGAAQQEGHGLDSRVV